MKKTLFILSAILVVLIKNTIAQTNTFPTSGSTGLGTLSPHTSALLEMQSTTQGMLAPRMTKAQRNAIVSPATGLLIFQTNAGPGFYFYDGAGWTALSSTGGASKTLGNLNPTAINQSLNPNADNTLDLGSASNSWNDIFSDGNAFISNVAIGTSTVESKLTINGTNEVITIDGTDPYISMENSGSNIGYLQADGNDLKLATYIGNDSGRVILRADGSDELFVHPSGEISINTGTPYSGFELGIFGDLHVSSQIALGTTDEVPTAQLTISGTDDVVVIDGTDPYIQMQDDGENIGFVRADGEDIQFGLTGSNDDGKLILRTNSQTQMYINDAGDIVMGLESVIPKSGYKLNVDGRVVCEELRVEISPWADYVFDENYRLMNLYELEKFINGNNHLPGIPAANEIEMNGLHVGEMQGKMMEKIEELTLYIIELQKQNDLLAEKISALESK